MKWSALFVVSAQNKDFCANNYFIYARIQVFLEEKGYFCTSKKKT